MHRSGSQECGQESDEDDSTLDRCDGVMSPWQAWYTSEVPKQVRGVCMLKSWTALGVHQTAWSGSTCVCAQQL